MARRRQTVKGSRFFKLSQCRPARVRLPGSARNDRRMLPFWLPRDVFC